MTKAICKNCDRPIYRRQISKKWVLYGFSPMVFDNCKHEPKEGTLT